MLQLARGKHSRKKFRRGHAPYLAKIRFYWCDVCNVPRIAETECSVCGSPAREVKLSPPGDPFPAMEGHLQRAIHAINAQFGEGVGQALLPSSKTMVLNKVSSLDAMYEIIVDGYMIGRLRLISLNEVTPSCSLVKVHAELGRSANRNGFQFMMEFFNI